MVYYVYNDAVPSVRPASQPVIYHYYMRFLILFVVLLTYLFFLLPSRLPTCIIANRLQLFKLVSQGGYTEKPNTRGIDKDSKQTSAKNSLESPTEFGYKCVCLNARSIVNERN